MEDSCSCSLRRPLGIYAECGRSCHAGTVRSTQEAPAQPHTESSTEAMDTDKGQRTTASQHILP